MKGLDLSKFKKVAVEKDCTVLKHPDGHEIRVAHQKLSSDVKKQLEKLPSYADGGEVKKPVQPSPPALPSEEARKVTQDSMRKAFGYADGGQVSDMPTDVPMQPEQPMPMPGPAPTPQPSNDPRADLAAAVKNLSQHYSLSMNPTPSPAPQAPAQPQVQQPQAPQQASPDIAPQVMPQQPPQQPAGSLVGQAQQDVAQQNAAESGMAQNTQQAMSNKADIMGNQAQQLQDMRMKFEQHGQQLHQKFDEVADQVSNGKIDPNHWWDSKSTGSKVLTAIGMLFAGAGSGVSGHPEMVNNVITKAIDRDIDAQKADLSNKNTLLSKYMDMYKSLPEAEGAARLTLNAAAEGLVNQQAAKLGSQNATLMAQAVNAKRRQELLPTLEGLAKGQMMMGMYSDMAKPTPAGTDPEQAYQNHMSKMRILNPDLGKDMEAKYLPGVGAARVPVPEKIRDELTARKDLSDKLAQLENFASEHQGTTLDRSVVNQGKALAAQVQDSYRRANQQGVFKESEAKFVNSVIAADPTSFLAKTRTIPGYAEARKLNNGTIQQYYKSYGIKPFKSEGSDKSGGVSKEDAIAEAKRRGLIK